MIVDVPGSAPAVLSVAVEPLPETVPDVALQLLILTGTLSGLVQVQVKLAFSPTVRLAGLAEQEMVGGFLGGSFAVKLAVQLVSPPFFILASVMFAVTW